MAVMPLWAEAQPGDITPLTDLHLQIVDSGDSSAGVNSDSVKGISVHVTDADGHGLKDVAVSFHLPESGASGKFADGSLAAVAYTDNSGQACSPIITWNSIAGSVPVRITAAKGASHAGILFEQTLTAASASATPARDLPAPAQKAKAIAELAAPATAPHVEVSVADLKSAPPRSPQSNVPPSVSVTSASPGMGSSHSKAKWFILAGIAVAAGAGAAMAGRGKSTTSAAPSASISIGSPSISVGHP